VTHETATHWQHVHGDGLVYDGPCIVKAIIFEPVSANDYADIYDGRDAVSGSIFIRAVCSVVLTWSLDLADGVLFGKGIYVDGIDGDVSTVVAFIPL
jgi:hypothetical protein